MMDYSRQRFYKTFSRCFWLRNMNTSMFPFQMQCCVFPAHHWHFSRTSHPTKKTCSFILQIYTLSLKIYIHQLTWHSVFIHLHTANQFPLSSSLLTQRRQRANVAETQSMEWKVIMFTCLKLSGRADMCIYLFIFCSTSCSRNFILCNIVVIYIYIYSCF